MTRTSLSAPWSDPVNLGPVINSPAFEEDGYISPDGSTLYFDSAREGGHGGHDLWQAPIRPIVDFNGDEVTDSRDVEIMLYYWGQDEPMCDIGDS